MSCDDEAALTDAAETIAATFNPPLTPAEIRKTVRSVWKYETEDRNWFGKEARAVTTAAELAILIQNPGALALRNLLQIRHGGRTEPFAICSKAMAAANVIPGWGPKHYSTSRQFLLDWGFLRMVYKGGAKRGDASLYVLSTPPLS